MREQKAEIVDRQPARGRSISPHGAVEHQLFLFLQRRLRIEVIPYVIIQCKQKQQHTDVGRGRGGLIDARKRARFYPRDGHREDFVEAFLLPLDTEAHGSKKAG